MIARQARASVRVMRLWKPHDPGRSCLRFTIRHHVANETDSQNDGALGGHLRGRVRAAQPAPPPRAAVDDSWWRWGGAAPSAAGHLYPPPWGAPSAGRL